MKFKTLPDALSRLFLDYYREYCLDIYHNHVQMHQIITLKKEKKYQCLNSLAKNIRNLGAS